MSLFFLRHLKTANNDKGIISGKTDSTLIPNQHIYDHPYEDTTFDIVLCSPMKRCMDTISLISKERKINTIQMVELVERDMGDLEGFTKAEALHRFPLLFYSGKVDVNSVIPNGESVHDVFERLEPVISYIKANEDKNVLVCSHNQTMKVLYCALCGISVTNAFWQVFNFPNGVMICFEDIINSSK